MHEVIIGTGHTFAEKLAGARVEAGIALWALPYGADWDAAWRSCPRPDWVIEMVMLGVPVLPGCAVHREVIRLLWCEVERMHFILPHQQDLLGVVAAWTRGEADGERVEVVQTVSCPVDLDLSMREFPFPSTPYESVQNYCDIALYLLAQGVSDPVSPALCARALAYASTSGRSPYAVPLAEHLARALPCPERLKVVRVPPGVN